MRIPNKPGKRVFRSEQTTPYEELERGFLMPAATTKSDLLSVTLKDYGKLQDLIEKVPEAAALAKDDDGASIKDIIGHRGHWIELFLGWYGDGQAGKDVFFPAKGYKWNELKAYNADLRKTQETLGWTEAVSLLQANHEKLVDLIESLDEKALYAGPMKGANNDWTTGRWAEAAGPSHYRSAAKYIRQRLKVLAANGK